SSRRRHTRSLRDWSSDVCSSDLSQLSGVNLLGVELTIGLKLARAPRQSMAELLRTIKQSVDHLVERIHRGALTFSQGSRDILHRSEERRVGKERRSQWSL